jgi:uncharacterized DUF497 family protein
MNIHFEWIADKAITNKRKHKVDFNEACSVFYNPLARIFIDDDHSMEERREIIIGHSTKNRLLIVCFTERSKDTIRLFSARTATLKERKPYEEENIS